jgi:hypothetical protein
MINNNGTINIAMTSGTLKRHGNETDCSIFLLIGSPQVTNTVQVFAILLSNSQRDVIKNRLPNSPISSIWYGESPTLRALKPKKKGACSARARSAAITHYYSEDWPFENLA